MPGTDATVAGILCRFTSQWYSNASLARRGVQTGTLNPPDCVICGFDVSGVGIVVSNIDVKST